MNDASLPQTAVAAAKKLIDTHQCCALIGNLLSNVRIAVAYQVAEPRKVPFLNFSFYEGSILSRYFFHFAALPNQQIDKMIPYMAENFGPRMFFTGNNYEWPRGSIDAAKRMLLKLKGDIVGEEYLPIGICSHDIDQLLDQIAESNADVLVPYFAGNDQIKFLRRFTSRGLKSKITIVMGHFDEMMASKLDSEVRKDCYSSNTYFMSVDSPENRNYLQKLAELPDVAGIWPQGNGILTNFGEGTFNCVNAFAKAANKAGSIEPEALIETLKTVRVTGPQGEVSMTPNTHHAVVNSYLSCCRDDGTFRIVKNFGAIAPIMPERYSYLGLDVQSFKDEDLWFQSRMLRYMSEGICLISLNSGTIVYTNYRMDKMFGYDTQELLDKPLATIYSSTDVPPHVRENEIKSILYKKGVWEGDLKSITKCHHEFWTSFTISTFTHPKYGEVWMAVIRDISERKKWEEQQQKDATRIAIALEKARQSDKAKSEFLANMSHEIRTPMTAILGFSRAILTSLNSDKLAYDKLKHYLEVINRNGNHLMQIIDDILDLSKIEAGKLTIKNEYFSVKSLLQETLEPFFFRANQKSLDIKLIMKECLNDIVFGCPQRIRQIIINLIGNAIKFTDSGTITITAYQAKNHSGDHKLHIAIRDTGIGIAKDDLAKIFNHFMQVDSSSQRSYGGAGLGLSISKRLASMMHGSLTVSSEGIGKGCLFELTIPVSISSSLSNHHSDNTLAEKHQLSKKLIKRRVLVVDDSADILSLASHYLESSGNVHVDVASSGESAIQKINEAMVQQKNPFDLVFMDLNMPHMDGYEAAKRIKTLPNPPKVIAFTASVASEDQKKALDNGFDSFVRKPFRLKDLFAELIK